MFHIDIELEKHMTRRQKHIAYLRRISRTDDNSTIGGICPDLLNRIRQLIHSLTVKISSLMTVDRPKITSTTDEIGVCWQFFNLIDKPLHFFVSFV